MEHTHIKSNGNIVAIIRSQGRSVAWLAREIGVSRQFTSDAVHGHVPIRRELAERIADKLQVPFFMLFDVSSGKESVAMERVA